MAYSDKLKDPRWQKKRLEIMNRDNWTCKLCGDKGSPLQVHHLEYSRNGNPWDVEDKHLTTLCDHCHLEVEKARVAGQKISMVHKTISNKKTTMIVLTNTSILLMVYDKQKNYVCGGSLSADQQDSILSFITSLRKDK